MFVLSFADYLKVVFINCETEYVEKFSLDLIQRLQKYFADKYGKNLTREEAEEYLDSFADFYFAIIGTDSDSLGGDPKIPAETSDSPDLIYPHNSKSDN